MNRSIGKTRNAQIESTRLGRGGDNIESAWLYLEYGKSGGQGFGGYTLTEPIKDADERFIKRQGHAFGMEYIMQILEILQVDSWEKLPGTRLRVDQSQNKVYGIGHYLEDNWFYPVDLAKEFFPKEEDK